MRCIMACKHDEFKLYYIFEIFSNENFNKKTLLFWGVANYCIKCKKFYKFNDDIWTYNKYGYLKLKNYSDYIEKYGKLPCVLVNSKKEPIDINTTYPNESTIRKVFGLKASNLYASRSRINPDNEANNFLELENFSYEDMDLV